MKMSRHEDDSYELVLEGGRERAVAMLLGTAFKISPGLSRRDKRAAAKFGEYLARTYPLEPITDGPPIVPEMLLSGDYAKLVVRALAWHIETNPEETHDEDIMSDLLEAKAVEMYLQIRSPELADVELSTADINWPAR